MLFCFLNKFLQNVFKVQKSVQKRINLMEVGKKRSNCVLKNIFQMSEFYLHFNLFLALFLPRLMVTVDGIPFW